MTNRTIDPISYNAGIEAADETGWLIEKADTSHGVFYLRTHEPEWTQDVNRALRFHREADAHDFSCFVYEAHDVRVVEHMWSALHRTEPQTAPDDAAKRFRAWPHDEPNGWNLNAARFVDLLQSQPMMWLRLTRAKYIEMRIDTRDGGFNLYDRDRQPLEPDEVVAAIKEATEKYGAGLYRQSVAAPADAERLALAERIATALRDYHYALDMRQHGGVAANQALVAIQQAMELPWIMGKEKTKRATPKNTDKEG
jgi:hypothetical protein